MTVVSFAGGYPRFLFPGRTDQDPSGEPEHAESRRILSPLLPWTWLSAGRAVAALHADMVLFQWWTPFWAPPFAVVAAYARRSGAKVVLICHNVWPHDRVSLLDRVLTRLMLARADGFLAHAVSDADTLKRLRAGAVTETTLLPTLALTRAVPRAEARRALALPADAAVVLFFGFVRPYKGLPYLVRAVAEALKQVPEIRLVVAGETWGRGDDVEGLAQRLGIADRVLLVDRYVSNEEVGLFMGAADLVALPYVEATQSGVATLAFAAGVPVVASAVGGLPDAITNGVNGLLVPPADVAGLATALVRVFREPGLHATLVAGVQEANGRCAGAATVACLETSAGRLDGAATARLG